MSYAVALYEIDQKALWRPEGPGEPPPSHICTLIGTLSKGYPDGRSASVSCDTVNQEILRRERYPQHWAWTHQASDLPDLREVEIVDGEVRPVHPREEPNAEAIRRERHVRRRKEFGDRLDRELSRHSISSLARLLDEIVSHDPQLESARQANGVWRLGWSRAEAAVEELRRVAATLADGELPANH